MRSGRAARRAIVALALGMAVCLSPATLAQGQDALTRAKGLYASAEFEAALQVLETLRGSAASPEAAAYQVYCLVALDRRDEARTVVERIVEADPLFRPAQDQVAPRIRAFFEDTRKPLLPDVARQAYAKARIAFDKNDLGMAVTEFERVIVLFDEIGGADPSVADLRMLAVSYRDRARAALTPASAAKPDRPASSPNPADTPAEPAIYGAQNTNVSPPIPMARNFPEWRPNFFELNQTFAGDIALVIGEDGKVQSASMVSSVHPRYDGPLLEAAKGWTFKPAMKNGSPVRYRYVMTVRVLK